MVDVTEANIIRFIRGTTGVLTVVAFAAGVFMLGTEGDFPAVPLGVWYGSIVGCFAASVVFGVIAAWQGRKWPLFISSIAGLILFLLLIGNFIIGGV
jgi:hypothetical protein